MTTWVRRTILQARLPGVQIPELQDLQEAKTMLAERAATWTEKWVAEGYHKGLRGALAAQAEEKFGPLEPHHADRIAKASEDRLSRWLKNILTATTTDELFQT